MANPRFADQNGNFDYIWEELPVIPSDRPDVDDPVNVDRASLEYKHAGIVIDVKFLTQRGKWSIRFKSISESMTIALRFFFHLSYFRFYSDADDLATFKEVFIQNQFTPKWQPGGRYDLTLELRQYS